MVHSHNRQQLLISIVVMEAPLSQRLQRFADEDLGLLVGGSALFSGFLVASELRNATATPRQSRLGVAFHKASPKFPAAVFSAVVGLAGMKLAIAGVTYYRQDFSRQNVVLAFPVFGALMNLHRGPRVIAKGVAGFAALGLGIDQAAAFYHRRNFEAQRMLESERWRREAVHMETSAFAPHFEVLGTSPRED